MIKLRVAQNSKHVRLIEAKMLTRKNVPDDYLKGFPHCYKIKRGIFIKTGVASHIVICKKTRFSHDAFKSVIELIFKCGDRLRRINELREREVVIKI